MVARGGIGIKTPESVKGVKGSVKGKNTPPSQPQANIYAAFGEVLRVLRGALRACARNTCTPHIRIHANATRTCTRPLNTLNTLHKSIVVRLVAVKGSKTTPSHPSHFMQIEALA